MTKEKTKSEKKRLVVFDIEGILIPKNRYLLFEISSKVGFFGFIQIIVLGLLYEIGLLSLESALKKIFLLFKGLKSEEVLELHKRIPLMPGVEEVFKTLNEKGYRTALISSGIPVQIAEALAIRLKANYAFGLELEIIDEHLTGAIGGAVIKRGGKAIILEKILNTEGLTSQDCIMVADDRNNMSMFPLCKQRIGYNPDFILTAKSDFVTRGSLTDILPPIIGEVPQEFQSNNSRIRGLRETIHIGSFLLTFICIYFLGNVIVASLILLITGFYIISEIARVRGFNIPGLSSITWNAVNKTELYEFATAPIHFAIGIVGCLLIFPEPISYVAITVLTLGDGGAHIFGIKFGKNRLPFNKGKNVEGTVFGFIFAFLGSLFFVDPRLAFIAATVGMMVEAIPSPLNDNLT
ncbi:haloacid dehalogenase-like hydrolase, partial [Candidatus Bathyarchaeota archaeon]|nr:haloacid dehalogenase-like hydrolase [Candidatus Bathyarchaeota archaeon]